MCSLWDVRVQILMYIGILQSRKTNYLGTNEHVVMNELFDKMTNVSSEVWYNDAITMHFIPPGFLRIPHQHATSRLCKMSSILNAFKPERIGRHLTSIVNSLYLTEGIRNFNNFPRYVSGYLAINQSTPTQVQAWCHQATDYHLKQCWPRLWTRYGVTRPQRAKRGCKYQKITSPTRCNYTN